MVKKMLKRLILVSLFSLLTVLAFSGLSNALAQVIRTSDVSTVVSGPPGGPYTYNYTVRNTSPAPQWIDDIEVWPTIVDYEVPLDDPSLVWDILSPEEWGYEFISFDEYIMRFGEPNPFLSPWVLHWYTGGLVDAVAEVEVMIDGDLVGFKPIVPTGYNSRFETSYYEPETDGFIFTSNLSPVSGPYLASWQDQFRNIGDPPLPGGAPVSGGGTPPFHPIPEPSSLLLLGIGLSGLVGLVRKKLFKKA